MLKEGGDIVGVTGDRTNFLHTEVVAQVLIRPVGGTAFQVTHMGGKEWAIPSLLVL